MMQRILTALVLIPLVLLLILRAPGWVLAVVAGIVALLAIREFLALARHYAAEPFLLPTYIFTAALFLLLAIEAASQSRSYFDFTPLIMAASVGLFAALAPFVFLSIGLKRQQLGSVYPQAAASVFAFTYIAMPMGLLISLAREPNGEFELIYLMLVVWSGDIFAYFVGKSIGRHKMSPLVSPKKTWEGAAASLLASIAFGTLFCHYSLRIGTWLSKVHLLQPSPFHWRLAESALWRVVLISALLNFAAQLGDLVESAIKRGANVKDSGAILPGHGGMLDRVDAMLFAAPVLWLFSTLFF